MSSTASLLAAVLADPSPAPVPILPTSSPAAELITVTCAGIAAILTAVSGALAYRKRRDAPVGVEPLVDIENTPTRIRERLVDLEARLDDYRALKLPDRVTVLETRLVDALRRVENAEELLALHRASDVVLESEQAPRRRRKAAPP